MADLGSALQYGGGAVSDLFGSLGDFAESKAYRHASTLADYNAAISNMGTDIQQSQASRELYRSVGAQAAEVGGAGFASSGSNLDLMRSSVAQGSLTKQLIQAQGTITASGYEQEAAAYKAMSSTAKTSGTSGILGGIVKAGEAVATGLSLFGL